MEDYYQILEVSQQATCEEIKAAYRSLCQEYHPDKLPPGTPAKARKYIEDHFKRISHAYSTIGNPETRQAYDLSRSSKVAFGRVRDPQPQQFNPLFEPEQLIKATARLQRFKNSIDLECQEMQVEIDRVVQQHIKGLGFNEADLRSKSVLRKIISSTIGLFMFSLGLGLIGSGNGISLILGIFLAIFSLLYCLRKISSPTLSMKNARKIQVIKQKANERKSIARKKRQKQLDDLKEYQQQRITFFKSIPIFMISEDYIATLTPEDRLYLLQGLDRRKDAVELSPTIKASAQVAIETGVLNTLANSN